MTAEVVILNRTGVALAADSAVTIGDSKVYNTVNKLFPLSKYHPIGVMIYGNAEYMTIPWETVIKSYREELGDKSFPTVKDYGHDFVRFLDRGFLIDRDDERQRVSEVWSANFRDTNRSLRRKLLKEAASKALAQADVTRMFLGLLKEQIAHLKSLPTMPQYRSIQYRLLHNRYKKEFDDNKDFHFRGRRFSRALIESLREYAGLLLIKPDFRLSNSGLIFAGFGDDEIFPAMQCMICAGRFFWHLKLIALPYTAVTSKELESVYIRPFAQGEMVYRFMEGIDESYSKYLKDGINQLMKRLSENLINKYSTATDTKKGRQIAAAQRTIRKMTDEFEEKAKRLRYSFFVKPVLNIVAMLPKEELAELAGALVNITSLKRKMSMDAETVGGPIDVAVISKGDGFIWIRRKHYFKAELNPSFIQKYLQSS
jgi:hypothetical protein